jgi:glutathione S-transferase
MLKIWGRRNSFNVQKVMWLVGELGLEHEHVPAGGHFGGLDDPAFLALNPHGRVPVLQDGSVAIWESHAILRYLAAVYGHGQFWAEDAGVRSIADRWMDWAQTRLQPDFLEGVFWGFYRTPAHLRDVKAVQAKVAACAADMRLLEEALSDSAYLGGDALSLADIPAGAILFRYYELEIRHGGWRKSLSALRIVAVSCLKVGKPVAARCTH